VRNGRPRHRATGRTHFPCQARADAVAAAPLRPRRARRRIHARGSHTADAATGLETDFEAFFRHHQQDIFGYLWRLTGEEQTAYDLSQETFIRAWQHFTDLRRYDHPAGWLFRVATNLALKHLRHRRIVTRLVTTPLHDDDDLAERGGRTPADHADYAEQVVQDDLVRVVLLALAPRPRALLVLHDVYGLSTDEVARTLNMSRAAVKMMLCRAREQFRIRYRRQEAQP
jgi:RNA polymerase sigma-70 factor, ECF subfamily